MKKITLMLLILVNAALCQYTEGLVTNTFYGGLALGLGKGSSNTNPGITLCIEPIRNVSPYFGIGGHVEYCWLSSKKPDYITEDFSLGSHIIDLALVPKAVYPFAKDWSIALEFDPGLYVVYSYYINGTVSNSQAKPYFGLTTGTSLHYGIFACSIKFKTVFARTFEPLYDNIFSKGKNPMMLTFNIGMTI